MAINDPNLPAPGVTADVSTATGSVSQSNLIKSQSSATFTGGGLTRIIKVDDSTGCTLTNASIKGLTPAEFEALSNKEIDLARVIASSAEAKMLGVKQRG
ncbi:MAG: hypothetical protein ACO2ZZ_12655, partial [Cyclobacteriaceae bacterium]